MDFIGRTSELATLNAELERGSGFVVIYGRRRVGKTTLIKEFIKDKRAFYFLATTESEAQSMKRFAGCFPVPRRIPCSARSHSPTGWIYSKW